MDHNRQLLAPKSLHPSLVQVTDFYKLSLAISEAIQFSITEFNQLKIHWRIQYARRLCSISSIADQWYEELQVFAQEILNAQSRF